MPAPLAATRHVLRKLRRAPLFTVAAIITLAVGIGAPTAIFTVVNSVLLKPLPYERADELIGVWQTAPGLNILDVNQGPATYLTYREESRTFEDIGLWDETQVSVTGKAEPERVSGMLLTDGTLPLLRARPRLGRNFTKEEDAPGGAQTIILSDGYWRRHYAGDPGAVGQTLTVDGIARQIIGVMPPEFRFLGYDPAIYLPFRFNRAEVRMGNFSYQGLARLKPGVSLAQASADVARMIPLATEKFPGGITLEMLRQTKFGPNLRPLKHDVIGDVGKVLWILLGTVGIVLLIACANVANLFLVRAEGLQREMAVRTALGAGWWRVAREFLAESMMLGALGGIVGVGLAWAGVRLLVSMGPESLPRLSELVIDPVVLAFAAVLSVVAGVLFGLLPVLKYARPNLVSALKEGGRANSTGRERHRARNTLVVAQIALALVLLTASGLMMRTFQSLRHVDPGFRDPQQVQTFRLFVPPSEVADEAQVARVQEQLRERLMQLPGVMGVGIASSITMDGNDSNDAVWVQDFPTPEGQVAPIRRIKAAAPELFQVMGNPLRAGRAFDWAEVRGARPVAIVSENFAREYWKEPAKALGRRIRRDIGDEAPWYEIVGVVGPERDDGVSEDAPAIIYLPLVTANASRTKTDSRRDVAFAVRSGRVGSESFMDEIRKAIWSVNANLPLANVVTLDGLLQRSMARTSFMLVMLAIAAVVALLLGAVGIYGVISYIVAQRTREIGVRMALGAQRADVTRMVLRQGVLLALAGLATGIVAAASLSRVMRALLFGVSPADPWTYVAVSLTVSAVAVAATWLPARRAARLDPVEALRVE